LPPPARPDSGLQAAGVSAQAEQTGVDEPPAEGAEEALDGLALISGQLKAEPSAVEAGMVVFGRVLASSVNNLVNACRLQVRATMVPVGTRLHETWTTQAEVWLQIEATSLHVEGEKVLDVDPESGGWVLPAFMAGLRGLRPKTGWSYDDVIRLCEELSTLTAQSESIEDFRDWLWSDGANGFEIDLRRSFTELMETAAADHRLLENTLERSTERAWTLGTPAARLAIAEVELAAAQETFEASRKNYAETMKVLRGALLDENQLQAIGKELENEAGWTLVETEVAIAVPAMRSATSPDRVAQRLASRISRGVHASLLEKVMQYMSTEDEYASEVVAWLARQGLGTHIAAGMDFSTEANRRALDEFATLAAEETTAELIAGLLERAKANAELAPHVQVCIRNIGLKQVVSIVNTETLDAYAGKTLSAMMLDAEVRSAALGQFIVNLTGEAARETLASLPDARFWRLRSFIRQMLLGGDHATVTMLVELLGEKADRRGHTLLIDILEENKGEGWSPRLMRSICEVLARHELGKEHILKWARKGRVSTALRIAAVRGASRVPALRKQILKRRFSSLVDPDELRYVLAELRAQKGEFANLRAGTTRNERASVGRSVKSPSGQHRTTKPQDPGKHDG
jgi:hypothetical protein